MIVIERRRVLVVTATGARLVFTGPDRLMRALAYTPSF